MLSVCRSLRRLLAGSTVAAAILRLAEQQKLKLDADTEGRTHMLLHRLIDVLVEMPRDQRGLASEPRRPDRLPGALCIPQGPAAGTCPRSVPIPALPQDAARRGRTGSVVVRSFGQARSGATGAGRRAVRSDPQRVAPVRAPRLGSAGDWPDGNQPAASRPDCGLRRTEVPGVPDGLAAGTSHRRDAPWLILASASSFNTWTRVWTVPFAAAAHPLQPPAAKEAWPRPWSSPRHPAGQPRTRPGPSPDRQSTIPCGISSVATVAELSNSRFSDLAQIVGGLPRSAYAYRPWWTNNRSHPQAKAWLEVGYEAVVDWTSRKVRFYRRREDR